MRAKVYALIMVFVSGIFSSMALAEVEIPEAIKKVAPIYEGAKVIQSMQIQEGAQAIIEVQATPKEVITFYKDAMQQRGWKVVMQMDMEKNSMLNLAKNNTSLVVNASAEQEGKTMVQLLLKTNN
jgi:hypothetical protein